MRKYPQFIFFLLSCNIAEILIIFIGYARRFANTFKANSTFMVEPVN